MYICTPNCRTITFIVLSKKQSSKVFWLYSQEMECALVYSTCLSTIYITFSSYFLFSWKNKAQNRGIKREFLCVHYTRNNKQIVLYFLILLLLWSCGQKAYLLRRSFLSSSYSIVTFFLLHIFFFISFSFYDFCGRKFFNPSSDAKIN